jgi:hypothetical protein
MHKYGCVHVKITMPAVCEIANSAVTLFCEKCTLRSNCKHYIFCEEYTTVHFVYRFCIGTSTAAGEEHQQKCS